MTTQNCRIRVKMGDFEFEVEGDSSFVLEQFRSTKLHERVERLVKNEVETSLRKKTTLEKKPLVELPYRSLQEFFNEKGRPSTTAERVAIIAYWLEHHEGKNIFKNKEISDLWVNELRLRRPRTTSTLCRDAKDKGWLNPAGRKMGYWQLSLHGKDFVEKELPPKSE